MSYLAEITDPDPGFVEATAPPFVLGAETLLEAGRLQGTYQPHKKWVFLAEKPWHNVAARLVALGMTQKEVASTIDKSSDEISELKRQDWFQARVQEFIDKEAGGIANLFKAAAFSAYTTLVELHQNPKTPAAVRATAADKLLDRYLGKATQFVDVKSTSTSSNVVEENMQLEARIKQMAGQLKILPVSSDARSASHGLPAEEVLPESGT